MSSLRMRQSVAEFERAFHEHTHVDRARRHEVHREAVQRTKVRHRERHVQGQSRRFITLCVTLLTTVVVVSYAMFQTLAWLMS